MKNEITFSYLGHRCHAKVLAGEIDEAIELQNANSFIGRIDGFDIYKTYDAIFFDQFGFVAIPSERRN